MDNNSQQSFLQIRGLEFRYGTLRKKTVLRDFSLDVEPGKVYGLLGLNGAGKSTLLYLIAGLLTPAKGSVTYQGLNTRRRHPATLADIYLVPEEYELPKMSLKKYAEVYGALYPRFSTTDMEHNLKIFELDTDIADLSALSMGQRKKVLISFAFATHCRLLIMDEPTNGLDIPGKSQFRRVAACHIDDDSAVIISTHQVRDIDSCIDHVIIIDNSRVLLDESVATITSKLRFVESAETPLPADTIYAQPSLAGHSLVLPSDGDEMHETEINLETLFGATLGDPQTITRIFNS